MCLHAAVVDLHCTKHMRPGEEGRTRTNVSGCGLCSREGMQDQGVWAFFVIHSKFSPNSKIAVCLIGFAFLNFLSFQRFDPKTHVIDSCITAISMAFTSPLQATVWVRRKVEKPSEPTSLGASCVYLFEEFLRIGGLRFDVLGMFFFFFFVLTLATGTLNITSTIVGLMGFPSPSLFRHSLSSRNLAR